MDALPIPGRVRITFVTLACLVLTACVLRGAGGGRPPLTPTPTAFDEAGEFPVATLDTKMHNRFGNYAVTIYFPDSGVGPYPAVVLSPGLAAHKDMYTWVGNHLASHGYVVAVFTVPFPWRFLIGTSRHEAGFVSAFDLMVEENGDPASPLYGHVDLTRRAIMGHSLGGLAGLRAASAMTDLDAVVVLAPAPGFDADKALAVTAPTQIQGTTRDCITGDGSARAYFASLEGAARQFIDINGGDHIRFNDKGSNRLGLFLDCRATIDPVDHQQRLSRRYFTAWLDYYVKGDETAAAYLSGDAVGEDLSSELLTEEEFTEP